ncbi:GATOR complex protein NPRL3 isoform X2 [Agrilus planipennis]|uniref:GATOR complex protein NPRL3 n=1 Tax=Agrilus planipennis TaxID=224129 RepID=A0A1W4X0A4_AGRPL|nr:GATOR complex protein NPRL3 isoform X2 [Agrilus planipennis]
MEVNPLCIILIKSDSKGDRLLFRYPFQVQERIEPTSTRKKNQYSLPATEDLLQSPPLPISNINNKGGLMGFTDEVLSSLFAVKPELCNQKFELKVNDVRFVSHPTLVQVRNKTQDESGLLLNIVFALQALASQSVVKCYYDLSKRVGVALRHEERRCGYISEQTQQMMAIHDDSCIGTPEIAFQTILEKCTLAKNINNLYEDLCNTGIVNIRINKWIPLSFCLPQKVHQWHLRGKIVEPEDIDRCLKALRPYHSLLLFYPLHQLYDFMSLDGSPSLVRMLSQYSPLKSLQTLAIDSDITLSQVFELTAHLVYWAKATVIYPICSTNKYVIAPDAPLHLNSPLIEKFNEAFPNVNLIRVISDFSLPMSLGQKCNPLCHPIQQSQLVQMIIWMLQHHLLLQLHTYVMYIPSNNGRLQHNMSEIKTGSYSFRSNGTNEIAGVYRSSRTESESEMSLNSGTPEPRTQSELQTSINLPNSSFTSVEEEKADYHEDLLLDFPEEERNIIFRIPSSSNSDDLNLFAKLCRKQYFLGEHHLEEIMYLENLRRGQLLALLDKFRDVLVTYEAEDPAIAMFLNSP